MEWCRDTHCHPQLPAPSGYGWVLESGKYEPVMCDACHVQLTMYWMLSNATASQGDVCHFPSERLIVLDFYVQRCALVVPMTNYATTSCVM